MDLRGSQWVNMDWIDLVENEDQWRALLNTVMNLRVP
jgi:predicted small integral membrane protein